MACSACSDRARAELAISSGLVRWLSPPPPRALIVTEPCGCRVPLLLEVLAVARSMRGKTGRMLHPPYGTPPQLARRATMAARKLMMLAATLLECHSVSALAIPFFGPRLPPPALVTRSIGTQLASVDPAVWAAGAGVAATIRKTIRQQREAVARLTIDEVQSSTSYKSGRFSYKSGRFSLKSGRFDRNRKALAEVVKELRNNEGFALSAGVLCRCAVQLFILPLTGSNRRLAAICPGWPTRGLWPELIRIVAVAIASLYILPLDALKSDLTLRPPTFSAAAALGFFGSGRLFVV